MERDRHDGRGCECENTVPPLADRGPDPDHDRDVHEREEDDQRAGHDGLLDHDVEVVQAVPEDGDGRGGGDSEEDRHE